jgi:aldehyde:ferredoxin oxidoreductase
MPYGWTGKLLKVDLTTGRINIVNSSPYFKFLGGRGFCARIAWEEIPPNIDAYDPSNRLIFATGPLTGTLAPTAGGRFEVAGISPQVYPKPSYTRSSVGGYWGAELKYAGFDYSDLFGKRYFQHSSS